MEGRQQWRRGERRIETKQGERMRKVTNILTAICNETLVVRHKGYCKEEASRVEDCEGHLVPCERQPPQLVAALLVSHTAQ